MSLMNPFNPLAIAKMYVAKADNAKRRNKKFEMSLITFTNIKQQRFCAYSGAEFKNTDELTLERIDNSIGYVDGNVIPVTHFLNTLRGSYTVEQFDKRIKYFESKINTLKHKIEQTEANGTKHLNTHHKNDTATGKPVFTNKLYIKYMNVYNLMMNLEKLVAKHQSTIEEFKFILKTKIRKCQKVHLNTQIVAIDRKIAGMKKQIVTHQKTLSNMFKKCSLYRIKAAKTPAKGIVPITELEKMKLEIVKYQEFIDGYKILQVAVPIFENMSKSEKEKIKLGLPLSTSRFQTMKHKMGCTMIVNEI